MKPIILHAHERSITQIKYNREGDLIFSTAKDAVPNVWYAVNGERLGSFVGHNGAVWCVDCNWDSTTVMTGAADNSVKLWDLETGKERSSITTRTAVRTCAWSYSGNEIFYTTDKAMGYPCTLVVADVRAPPEDEPAMKIDVTNSKITAAVWGPLSRYVVAGHENGELIQYDARNSGKVMQVKRAHSAAVNDIQLYKDETMFVTASKDYYSKLFDIYDLEHIKTYKTERPVNSAAISPLRDHVLLGGGQEASQVTTTAVRQGKFDSRFFHLVYEDEVARCKGHFGPINSVAFSPDGRGFSTGGEDGLVRMHVFDSEYYEFDMEC